MNLNHLPLRCAVCVLRVQPCALNDIEQKTKQPLWKDTPDAIVDCAACRPQSQCWRRFAPTTLWCEADHGQTTSPVTH